jgi:hypothetical protein
MIKKLFLALLLPAALALASCTSSLTARVQRFNAMPPPEGQSFVVVPAEAEDRGGLEFNQYADLVRRNLVALGYREAASRSDASLVVTLGYGVDGGRPSASAGTTPGSAIRSAMT